MIKSKQLLIDATSQNSYLYLIENEKEIINHYFATNQQDLSTNLIKYIDHLLTAANSNVNELDKIYLVYGPGKFSAMRICANVVKTMAMIKKIKIFIMDKFDYISEANSLCVLGSDGNKLFVCSYNEYDLKQDDVRLIDACYLDNVKNQFNHTKVISDNSSYYQDFNKIITKLKNFQETDENFVLNYLKPPC